MVNYDNSADALTLGDDDSLKVGDYELKYSSANDRFEVEHPNGEVSDVPRSTSGSLVPEGFADVLSNGEVLADNGEIYASVQDAVNAASGFVFVGPGTFNENVTISTEGLTLEGSGHDTLIDGGAGDGVAITSSNVTIKSLSARTTAGGGNAVDAVKLGTGASSCLIDSVIVPDSDRNGIIVSGGSDTVVQNCRIESCESQGIRVSGDRCIVAQNIITNARDGIGPASNDNIIVNNIILNSGRFGVAGSFVSNDCLFGGNRISNSFDSAIGNFEEDCIIFNNRVDNTIETQPGSTVLDGNLTGPSN